MTTIKQQIINALKNREAIKINDIEIKLDELDIYFNDDIPIENEIDYENIAEYIINANK